MFDENNPPNDRETIDALLAANIAAMNGLACLAICLRKRELMTRAELEGVQDAILKPFDMEYLSSNRVAQGMTARISELFSSLS